MKYRLYDLITATNAAAQRVYLQFHYPSIFIKFFPREALGITVVRFGKLDIHRLNQNLEINKIQGTCFDAR